MPTVVKNSMLFLYADDNKLFSKFANPSLEISRVTLRDGQYSLTLQNVKFYTWRKPILMHHEWS